MTRRSPFRDALPILSMAIASMVVPPFAAAGGLTPEEATAKMVLPQGFHAEVFASEPMIRQPLTVNFDERGRAWVIEYLQYPNPAGLKPVTVDQYLRTEYDRVPEPPPRGPRGADRIKILEDTDRDGKADKSTVFVEGLNLASALAVGNGGVYVGQAPYLLFYPDRDKNDVPDGDPEILLTGFGLQDAHATVNSMQWGPDGWLYGAQGSTVTARIRGVEFQQGIWRYHPRTKVFELFAEGGGNTWGLDFDAAGNAFGSSNGGFVAFHMVQGGNYWKGFAKHGPLHNPNSFGYFDALAYRGAKVGGHVTPGGIIYKADAYPPEYRGAFIGGNLLSNAVYRHEITPLGSTFAAKFMETMIDARDPWFRPIDLQVGPDGCIYVVDWYDKRASHLDPRDNWDKTNGRIYRIVHGDRRKVESFDLSKHSSQALVDLRSSPNDWYAAEARRLLGERRDQTIVADLRAMLDADRDEPIALRDLWALHVSGGFDDSTALGLLEHPVSGVRRWTIRLLGDDRRMNPSLFASLKTIAESDPDALVRSQLAASCQRWKANDALPLLGRLVKRDADRADPQIPLMLWWAFERQWRNDPEAVLALIAEPATQSAPIVRETILPRISQALASRGTDADLTACARLLAAAPGDAETLAIVSGMEKGLEGRPLAAVPPALVGPIDALSRRFDAGNRPVIDRLGARLGRPESIAGVLDRVGDRKAPTADRVVLVELLGQLGRPEGLPALLKIIGDDTGSPLALAAINAVGAFSDPELASSLLKLYPKMPAGLRDRVVSMLASRPEWANRLLDALAAKTIGARDIRPAQATQIAQHGDSALTRRVESLWGKPPGGPGSPEKVRRIAEVRGFLAEGDKGNADRGHPVFKENCAVCHKLFDEGENIGPDLTGSERKSLDFLLTSLVDPSAMVRKEYEAQTIALKDGRVLTGMIVDETGQSLTLFDANRQKTVLGRDQVEAIKPSTLSLMPEGLLDKLPENQVRDLFKYLQSNGPARK